MEISMTAVIFVAILISLFFLVVGIYISAMAGLVSDETECQYCDHDAGTHMYTRCINLRCDCKRGAADVRREYLFNRFVWRNL